MRPASANKARLSGGPPACSADRPRLARPLDENTSKQRNLFPSPSTDGTEGACRQAGGSMLMLRSEVLSCSEKSGRADSGRFLRHATRGRAPGVLAYSESF